MMSRHFARGVALPVGWTRYVRLGPDPGHVTLAATAAYIVGHNARPPQPPATQANMPPPPIAASTPPAGVIIVALAPACPLRCESRNLAA